jgi:hypothetical protein
VDLSAPIVGLPATMLTLPNGRLGGEMTRKASFVNYFDQSGQKFVLQEMRTI